MWLENTPQFFMWIMCSTFQRCSNLCRMVCVIINDGHSADFTFVFKTAVCSVEGSKTCLDRLRRNTKNIGNCDCRKCVIYVVLTANCKNEMCNILSVFYDIERGIALFVISNIGSVCAGEVERLLFVSSEKPVYRREIHHAQAHDRYYNKQNGNAYGKLFQKFSVFSVHRHLTIF